MNEASNPWAMPSKVKGESQIKPGSLRDAQFHQALVELSVAQSKQHGKRISPETILRTLATRQNNSDLAECRQRLRQRTAQLKKEKNDAKQYMDIKK
jgi:hypothetical protein